MEKKLFFYDIDGIHQEKLNFETRYVSEGQLPEFSEEHWRRCAMNSQDIPTNTPTHTTIRVAIGDPRIVECVVISFDTLVNADDEIRDFFYNKVDFGSNPITLEFEGKKIWTKQKYVCLEKDLL